jgi:hypothetical protein
MNDQINKAYDLLWEVFAKVREDEGFEVETLNTEEEEVTRYCLTKDLYKIISSIDTMLGR